jgi:hypothetical protein
MSHECPRCGLFSPEEATRCDCGYDFKTRTVQSSYLIAHLLEKHGGRGQHPFKESAKSNIRSGTVLLATGVAVSVIGYLASGNSYFFGGAVCGAHCLSIEACANVGCGSGWFRRRVAVTSLIASERIASCLTAAAPVDGRAANERSSNQGVRPSQVSRSPLDRRTHSFRAQKEPL